MADTRLIATPSTGTWRVPVALLLLALLCVAFRALVHDPVDVLAWGGVLAAACGLLHVGTSDLDDDLVQEPHRD